MGRAPLKHWISAIRLRTLPLALSIGIVGNSVALSRGQFVGRIAVFNFITILLLQILSNLANDYGDAKNGADNSERLGPARAVQSGNISPQSMLRGIVICSTLAFISGIVMLIISIPQIGVKGLSTFIALGLLSILAAYTYTAGRMPYGYRALGDVSVFVFFGLLGVLGTYYLHTGELSFSIWFPAIFVGCLSTAVLNLNNMRDARPDKAAGKLTIAILLGPFGSRLYHYLLIVLGVAALFLYIFYNRSAYTYLPVTGALTLVGCLPVLYQAGRPFRAGEAESPKLNAMLKFLALSTLFLSIVFSIAINI